MPCGSRPMRRGKVSAMLRARPLASSAFGPEKFSSTVARNNSSQRSKCAFSTGSTACLEKGAPRYVPVPSNIGAVKRRHVGGPVDLRHVVEDRSEQRVHAHLAVEAIHQQRHIGARRDVHLAPYHGAPHSGIWSNTESRELDPRFYVTTMAR